LLSRESNLTMRSPMPICVMSCSNADKAEQTQDDPSHQKDREWD